MTNVLSIKKAVPAYDIVRGLRRLADGIEAGTEVDWPISPISRVMYLDLGATTLQKVGILMRALR
jgi:hypothetical protein